MTLRKSVYSPILALMILVGAFFMCGFTASASETPPQESPAPAETLNSVVSPSAKPALTLREEASAQSQDAPSGFFPILVDEVWLTGDTLHIAVTDKQDGGSQTLELNLSDYAKPADEYVTVRATDSAGNTSNAVQFKNPYYVADAEPHADNGKSESAVPDGNKPFTPDGSGTVVDNAVEGDGKEFFTVETADGNTFYLIVDRQRNAENVYLLNAVSENDLASLAKPGDGKSVSAVETPASPAPSAAPSAAPESELEQKPETAQQPDGGNKGLIGVIIAVLVIVGGIGYYFKIVRPKQRGEDYETEDYPEPETDFREPGEEEPLRYDTDDDERIAEEGEVRDE